MQFDLLIKGGTVVTSALQMRADVGIQGEKIAALGTDLSSLQARRTLDATGKLVLPGAIDVHNHFQLPFCGTVSADDFENGTRSAAMGGVTTALDFAIQGAGMTIMETVAARRAEADPKVCIDYGLHAGITAWNEDRRREIPEIIAAGLPTFKMFMIYKSQGWQSTDDDIFAALRETARFGGMVGLHAENNDLIDMLIAEAVERGELGCTSHAITRPDFTESEAIIRAIQLAQGTGGQLYIFHMTTGKAARAVAEARVRGVRVHAETGPQYLLLSDELFARKDGHHFATCPPIRKEADQEALWSGLAREEVEVLATDTCTFTSEQKAMWEDDFRKIPFGMPGIETLLPLTHSEGVLKGRFSLGHMVRLLCENPARLFGMYPDKGTLAVGTDADLIVFDPELSITIAAKTLTSNCDYSPYEGRKATGWPVHTVVRGRPVVVDREFVGEPGYGRFIVRKPVG